MARFKQDPTELVQRVVELCEKKKMSLAEMCRQAGIPQSSWNNVKTRGSYPNSTYIERIAAALGVSPDYLEFGYDLQDIATENPVGIAVAPEFLLRNLQTRIENLDDDMQSDVLEIFHHILDLAEMIPSDLN